jgi:hypothetical protein
LAWYFAVAIKRATRSLSASARLSIMRSSVAARFSACAQHRPVRGGRLAFPAHVRRRLLRTAFTTGSSAFSAARSSGCAPTICDWPGKRCAKIALLRLYVSLTIES